MVIEAEYEEIEGADDQLNLADDESLPWLEAEEDDDGAGAVDTMQIIGFAAGLLLILLLIVGIFWYLGGRTTDPAQVADGSTIEAPEVPIKERPDDPGGKEFAGTGNVAPVIGGGGTSEGVLATDGNSGAADGASADAGSSGAEGGDGAGGENASASTSASGVGVQLAAYTSRSRAEQGWNDISRRTDALQGFRYRIEQGVVDIGTVYRLQAVASNRGAAEQLCAALKSDGIDCQVKP